jgi:glycosidase
MLRSSPKLSIALSLALSSALSVACSASNDAPPEDKYPGYGAQPGYASPGCSGAAACTGAGAASAGGTAGTGGSGGTGTYMTAGSGGTGVVEPGVCEGFDWRDTVMYFVLTDRFYDSDASASPVAGASEGDAAQGPSAQYEGGDLAGLTAKLPYLADLGVSALWITAPYENRNVAGAAINPEADTHMYSGFHGYWPSPADIDYTSPLAPLPKPQVESRIGTDESLKALVSAAHASTSKNGQGIKVLFDYVMKHVDTESAFYAAHQDWFYAEDGEFPLCAVDDRWDDEFYGTRCAFTDYLAPFDFYKPEVRAWSVNDAVWWAKEYGIDGYRLDAIKHVPLEWLTELRTALNTNVDTGEPFYLVGETFAYDDPELIKKFVDPATMLDGQFDFPFKARLCEAVFTPGGQLAAFAQWMDGNDSYYGAGSIMTTWIGNHDVPRAIHFASGQITNCRQGSDPGNGWAQASYMQPTDAVAYERLGLAFAVMMTNPGIPLIYYGDEVGLAGGGDPDNRRAMPWDDTTLNAHQIALRDRVKKLAAIRGTNSVIGRGVRTTLAATGDIWVYKLSGCEGAPDVLVAINKADAASSVTLPDGTYTDLMAGTSVMGGDTMLPARSFLVLQ